jgi:hypothetical protein
LLDGALHRPHRSRHGGVAALCDVDHVRGHLGGVASLVGRVAHGAGQLVHARRGLLERRSLLLRPRRQIAVSGRDLACGRLELAGALHHLRQHAVQFLHEGIELPRDRLMARLVKRRGASIVLEKANITGQN